MNSDDSGSEEHRPFCACALGPRRSWTVVLIGMVLVFAAVLLDLPWQGILIIGLIPLAVLVASALGSRSSR